MFSNKRVTDVLSITILNHIYHDCMFFDKKLGNLDIGINLLVFFKFSI